MSDPFIAEVRMFGFTFAPRDWAFCDGAIVQISENTALFSLIGATYGGDGRVTMGLPNLKSSVPMHWGRSPGLTQRSYGEKGGSYGVALNSSEIPVHTHTPVKASVDKDSTTPDSTLLLGRYGGNPCYGPLTNPVALSDSAIGMSGHSDMHENRQPFLAINFCICLLGTYPSRN